MKVLADLLLLLGAGGLLVMVVAVARQVDARLGLRAMAAIGAILAPVVAIGFALWCPRGWNELLLLAGLLLVATPVVGRAISPAARIGPVPSLVAAAPPRPSPPRAKSEQAPTRRAPATGGDGRQKAPRRTKFARSRPAPTASGEGSEPPLPRHALRVARPSQAEAASAGEIPTRPADAE